MPHWPFVIAAYVLGVGAIAGMLAWCWWSMRGAERSVGGDGA